MSILAVVNLYSVLCAAVYRALSFIGVDAHRVIVIVIATVIVKVLVWTALYY